MPSLTPSDRIRLRRHPERGVHDTEQLYAILDEAYVCHVGFVADGQPYVIPTGYGRAGHQIYVHGAAANRMLGVLAEGVEVCVTVTIVDGFVLSRAAFHHSLNYRSVVILGRARLVTDVDEKVTALRCLTNHIAPGRWEASRQPNAKEVSTTRVLAVPLDEASAKVRTGPPRDSEEDYLLPVWAGVIPVRSAVGEPVPDERVLPGVAVVDARRFDRT